MSRSGTHFHFKQFSIRHDQSAMKVGTDAVLLGTWVDVKNAGVILDVGTGSGVVALILAQRTLPDTIIHGVEIESTDALQAAENVASSPWPGKVKIFESAIQHFQPEINYDLIVANPPYFVNSLAPPDPRRIEARHTTSLSHDDLLRSAVRLLKPQGRLSIILPYTEGQACIARALTHNLFCTRQWQFRTRKDKPIERLLLTFTFEMVPVDQGEILLYNGDNDWSPEYRTLTRDFYLKL
jgi:tRNA1Val (adenine37-N6)-methyltransferase